MAVASLKAELQQIAEAFPKGHPTFRVINANIDEICCQFVTNSGTHEINCTISEPYPTSTPMWYSDSEDKNVTQVMEALENEKVRNKYVVTEMVRFIVIQLCGKFGLDIPSQIKELEKPPTPVLKYGSIAPVDISSSEEEDEDEDDATLEADVAAETEEARKETSDIGTENLAVLARIKQNQRKDYIDGRVSGSVQASDRLLKELKAIYKSDSLKKGCYSVELVNDSLYEWHVQILKVDPDSTLFKDLNKLKAGGGHGSVIISITFRDSFPFDPPFVRVVCPILSGGFVLAGGAICMELLTKQGWSSAYSIESLIMQIMATLVKGKAKIEFSAPSSSYSLSRAQQSFHKLVQIHEKNGWYTPPPGDG
uniref:Ubiquitin-conjugating enzyme E2 Q2 n=1 Tax=Phallusia mammillata TaxID=59560 RepID=A0A6F9DWR9_9ASCI|nr:ubiquitin-conjugating enzyme E2 Q2 [Phallusia mammillata]